MIFDLEVTPQEGLILLNSDVAFTRFFSTPKFVGRFGNDWKRVFWKSPFCQRAWALPREDKAEKTTLSKEEKITLFTEMIDYVFNIQYPKYDKSDRLLPIQSFDFTGNDKIAGHLYEPLLNFLRTCGSEASSEEGMLHALETHVHGALQAMSEYVYGKNGKFEVRTSLNRQSFYFGIERDSEKYFEMAYADKKLIKVPFGCNCKDMNPLDTFILRSGVIAMNTFFHEYEAKSKK